MEYEIKKTWDYGMFKKLLGNRAVSEKRIGKIVSSIQKVGYIMNPIIVNQNYEIIDGQGRLEALRRLMKPVYYIQVEGTGFQECISMNNNLSNWSIQDYLESYATQGNRSYMQLLELCRKHKISYKVACFAISNKTRISNTVIRNGAFEYSDEEFEEADKRLDYIDDIEFNTKSKGGLTYIQQATLFCCENPNIDKARLKKKIEEEYAFMLPWKDSQTAVDSLEDLYNRGLGVDRKVFLSNDFRKLMLMNSRTSKVKKNK